MLWLLPLLLGIGVATLGRKVGASRKRSKQREGLIQLQRESPPKIQSEGFAVPSVYPPDHPLQKIMEGRADKPDYFWLADRMQEGGNLDAAERLRKQARGLY